MKVLVVGAAGFAGSAFLRVLPQLGYECISITRENYHQLAGARADVLINANGNSAKYIAEKDPVGEIDRSVASVMRTCHDFTVDRYVLLSSADVYPCQHDPRQNAEDAAIAVDKLSVYGLNKYLAECVVRNRCRQWLILRMGGLLGPGLRKNPVFDLLSGEPMRVHPDSRFGYIQTDEVARIIAFLIRHEMTNQTCNVCGAGLVSVREMAAWAGRKIQDEHAELPRIHFEINNQKLGALWRIPSSATTAKDFITSWKSAHLTP